MKKISAILLILTAFTLNSCENTIGLESIANTTWRNGVDDETYIEYAFFSKGKARLLLSAMGKKTTIQQEYTIISSGHLKVRSVIAGSKGDWKYGQFDVDEGTLEIDGLIYDLIK